MKTDHKSFRDEIVAHALNAARLKTHGVYLDETGSIVHVARGNENATIDWYLAEALDAAKSYLLAMGIPEDLDPLKADPVDPV